MLRISKLPFLFLTLSISINCFSQTDTIAFKPSGRVIARAFADYSSGLSSNTNNASGFDLTRAFLGYNYRITPTLQAQVIIDAAAGHSTSNSLDVYVRNAFLQWADKGFEVNVGEIGMLQFNMQENYWNHRYVLKSFQDFNKMSASVDIGVTAEYTFSPRFAADITIVNGEGYKKVQKDNSNRYGVGVTAYPVQNFVVRAFGDLYKESQDMREALPSGIVDASYKNQYSLSLFLGYKTDNLSSGVEYNRVYNKGFIEKKDYFGYSVYASLKVAPKWRVYARYDNMDSSSPANFTGEWNNLDGQLMIGGVEYCPMKQLKISPNIRNINSERGESEQYLFINLEFNL